MTPNYWKIHFLEHFWLKSMDGWKWKPDDIKELHQTDW